MSAFGCGPNPCQWPCGGPATLPWLGCDMVDSGVTMADVVQVRGVWTFGGTGAITTNSNDAMALWITNSPPQSVAPARDNSYFHEMETFFNFFPRAARSFVKANIGGTRYLFAEFRAVSATLHQLVIGDQSGDIDALTLPVIPDNTELNVGACYQANDQQLTGYLYTATDPGTLYSVGATVSDNGEKYFGAGTGVPASTVSTQWRHCLAKHIESIEHSDCDPCPTEQPVPCDRCSGETPKVVMSTKAGIGTAQGNCGDLNGTHPLAQDSVNPCRWTYNHGTINGLADCMETLTFESVGFGDFQAKVVIDALEVGGPGYYHSAIIPGGVPNDCMQQMALTWQGSAPGPGQCDGQGSTIDLVPQ